jgi:hypothetical protein
MPSRQHSETQALYKTGKTRSATATPLLRGRMAVWFTRWLQGLLCEEFTLFHAGIATGAGRPGTPTNDRRYNVLRTRERASASNRRGAID